MALEREKDPIIKEIASIFQQISSINASTESPENEASLISSESESYDTQQVDQATKLKAYREDSKKINSELKTRNVSKAIFSSDQKKRISLLDEEVAKEEERRRIEEERRRQEEEQRRREEERRRQEEEQRRQEEECRRQEEERRKKEEEKKKERRLQEQLNAAMNRLRGKTFASNQEARRFFMNITAGLPEEIANKIVNRGLKWRCNAYDCVHDTPSECADPSRGGVWLIS